MLGRPPANGSKRSANGVEGPFEPHKSCYPLYASQSVAGYANESVAGCPGSEDRLFITSSQSPYESLSEDLPRNTDKSTLTVEPLADNDLLLPELPDPIREIQSLLFSSESNPWRDQQTTRLVLLSKENNTLAQYLLRYARTIPGIENERLNSLEIAIHDVIGCELAACLALGFLAMGHFPQPPNNYLNNKTIWRDALLTATLMQELAAHTSADTGLEPRMAFCCGLFHKIGVLLLADSFSDAYVEISARVENSEEALACLERQLLGIDHAEAGAQLLASWGFPAELALVCGHHIDPNYLGPGANYVYLCRIAKCLLSQRGLSICRHCYRAAPAIAALGIGGETAQSVTDNIVANMLGIDDTVASFPH